MRNAKYEWSERAERHGRQKPRGQRSSGAGPTEIQGSERAERHGRQKPRGQRASVAGAIEIQWRIPGRSEIAFRGLLSTSPGDCKLDRLKRSSLTSPIAPRVGRSDCGCAEWSSLRLFNLLIRAGHELATELPIPQDYEKTGQRTAGLCRVVGGQRSTVVSSQSSLNQLCRWRLGPPQLTTFGAPVLGDADDKWHGSGLGRRMLLLSCGDGLRFSVAICRRRFA